MLLLLVLFNFFVYIFFLIYRSDCRNVFIGQCDYGCTVTVSLCVFSMRNGNVLVILMRWSVTTSLAVSC